MKLAGRRIRFFGTVLLDRRKWAVFQAEDVKRESINEEELEKMPTGPEVPEKISSNTVTYEYIWSDNLIGDLAINTEAPARGREERMVA